MHFGHKSRAITLLFLNEIIPLAFPYRFSLIPMSMQSLKKIGKKSTKVRARKRSAKHFWHTSRAITLLFQNEISPLAIPYHSSPIPMSMQRLKKIGQKVLKLEHGNEALTDEQTELFVNEIIPLAIPYHSSMIPMSMQCICKILFQFVYSFLRYRPKMHFGHKSRAITLLFLNEIIPLAIPYRFSLIPMSMQSLKKIGQKVLKLEHGNEALMDGQTELFLNEIIPLAIPYHSSLIPMSMQCICKILFQFVYSVLRYRPIKLQAMQDAPPLQLYPASDKFLMWNQRKAAKYL